MPDETQVTEVAEVSAPEVQTEQQEAIEQQNEQTEEQADEQSQERPRDKKGRFKGVQQRFDELTKWGHASEREAAYWKAIATAKPTQQEVSAQKPTRDAFQSDEEFIEAVADWKAEQRIQEAFSKREEAERQRREVEETQRRQMTYAERAEAAVKEIPDFYEVVSASDIPVSDAVREVLIESDKGPELAYHLAKNPDVAEHLNTLSPLAAARELGRIEATLSKPAVQPKPVTKAPAPIKPIGQGQAATKAPTEMSMDEYKAMRAKQGARWAR